MMAGEDFPALRARLRPRPIMIGIHCLLSAFVGFSVFVQPRDVPPYKDAFRPIEVRIEDLLKRMTLQEKLNQLRCDPTQWEKYVSTTGFGETLDILRPLSNVDAAKRANEVQAMGMKSRLGIPMVIHDEALHGLVANGTTSFPQSIAMAATWDPGMVSRAATASAEETRARGVRHVLSPVINVIRDARWGRVEETYGEDPLLSSKMGVAFVKAFESHGVATTPKHFVDNSGDGGRDSNAIQISERELREIYLPPFEAVVKEGGASTLMCAYNSLNGRACAANEWLLTTILRKEWGFTGYVASDYGAVAGTLELHHNTGTVKDTAAASINAGLECEWPNIFMFGKGLDDAVNEGLISRKTLDEAVRRVLRIKFRTGVFDTPFGDPEHVNQIVQSAEHRRIALESARSAMTLLKNSDHILPLRKDIGSIALIGPNASGELPLGGYRGMDTPTVSVLAGIKAIVGPTTKVQWVKGSTMESSTSAGIDEAVELAKNSDVAIIVAGILEGEGADRAHLDLPGNQEELIRRVADTGKPIVVVLLAGSPVTMEKWLGHVPAVLDAWYPGQEGGTAIAETLFGAVNPAGRLPITFPVNVGQEPLYYNFEPTGRGYNYFDMTGKPQFAFGYGLSYTSFTYSNLRISPDHAGRKEEVRVSFDVQNIGKVKGDEVTQLYLHQEVASVVRPLKQLKDFARITLMPGETKTVSFVLKPDQLAIWNENMKRVIEPGKFMVMVGSSSDDIRLTGQFFEK